MAEQRPGGSRERSPAPETGMQIRDTAQEVGAQANMAKATFTLVRK